MQVKTTITKGLTQAYVRKLSRENYLATIACIFIVTVSLLWLVFQFGSQAQIGKMNVLSFFSDAMYAIASLIGALWCLRVTWRSRYGPVRLEPRHQLAWLLISLGLLSNAIGGGIYTYLEDYIQKNPVPSPSDVGFTLFYIFTFAGLLLMPRAIRSAHSRVRIALDATITTLCILAFSWFFVLRPIFASTSEPAMLYVSASYPFWDILLVLAIALVLYQGIEPVLYPSLILCALGVFSQIGADTIYAITVPQGTYTSGTWYIDSFWFLGYLLIGLSAPYQYARIARNAYREHLLLPEGSAHLENAAMNQTRASRKRVFTLHIFLAYIPLFLLLALVFYNSYSHTNDIIVLGIAVITGACVILRWILANYENDTLLEEREQRMADADLLRRLTTQLAEETQLDSLLTRVIATATTELRFDAAMLLLIENPDRPLGAQTQVLVRAQAYSGEMRTWSLQGEQLTQCAALHGKPVEITWGERAIHLPEELSSWHREHHAYATLFLPLAYQGKIQGSMGFATCTPRPFNAHDQYLARVYSDQVSAAIEHIKLYEQAQEHERFAQALSAVAARLNSTIAAGEGGGTDIFSMICAEGARALSADYAILYVPARSGQLLPAAAYSDLESEEAGQEWPSMSSHEKDATVLHSLQPVLIHVYEATASGKLPAVSGSLPVVSGPLPTLLAPVSLRQLDTAPHRAQSGRVASVGSIGGIGGMGSTRAYRHLSLRAALARRSVQTAILAPLLAGNQAVALLVMARSNRHTSRHHLPAFTLIDLGQAQDFAEQAAIAFTNAQLYQQLRDAHRQLQELDQLKDQFMVTASHELRTPLTSVQGYLELLAEFDANLPAEQRQEFLQKARRGCEELVLLLSNVMDASRLEIEAGIRPALLQRVSVQELIDDAITLVEPQLKQERRAVNVYLPAPIYVRADPARVRQVLLNLSSNALKYSPAGTPLAYHARALADRSSVVIGVSDKGKGIRPEDQARLFQRFVRLESDLNSSVRGSGLGLYISRRLIEAMNGRLWVESSGIPGAGSTFYIQLPLA